MSGEFDNAETTEIVLGDDSVDLLDETGEISTVDTELPAVTTSSANEVEFELGEIIGNRYRLVEHIHSGGMAHVYRAIDERLHNTNDPRGHVAIKVLQGKLARRADIRDAFEREAASLRSLAHPNIINVFDFDEDGDRCFLVMEWLDGESVQNLLRRSKDNRIDRDLAWRIIDAAAHALKHAHDNGVIHADINPANLFITWSGDIKLIDFGIARLKTEGPIATADAVWATRGYASPDVLSGDAAREKDDVFSLACTAYRLLSGEHPFDGMPADKAREIGLTPAEIDGLDADDWRILSRALSFDRALRPHSVGVFFRGPATTRADTPEIEVSEREKRTVPTTPPLWRLALERAKRAVPATLPLWQLAAAAAVVAAVLLWVLWPGERDASRPPARVASAPAATSDTNRAPEQSARSESIATESQSEIQATTPITDPDDLPATDGSSPATSVAVAESQAESSLMPSEAESVDRSASDAPLTDTSVADVDTDTAEGPVPPAPAAALDTRDTPPAEPPTATDTGSVVAATDAPRSDPNPPTQGVDSASEASSETITDSSSTNAAAAASAAIVATQAVASAEESVRIPDSPPADAVEATSATVAEPGIDPQRSSTASAASAAPAEPLASVAEDQTEDAIAGSADGVEPAGVAPSPLDAAATVALLDAEPASAAPSGEPFTQAASTAAVSAGAAVAPGLSETAGGQAAAAQSPDSRVAAAEPIASGQKVETSSQERKVMPISELNLTRYVAPRFPRIARYRDQTGYVDVRFTVRPDGSTADIQIVESVPGDVFVSSAEAAVGRWQFERRDDDVTAQVRLSFDLQE